MDGVEDAEPGVLGKIFALAARHEMRHRDVARHRLVALEQPGLRCTVTALGVPDQPPLSDLCRGPPRPRDRL
jgi:hypothetical protein